MTLKSPRRMSMRELMADLRGAKTAVLIFRQQIRDAKHDLGRWLGGCQVVGAQERTRLVRAEIRRRLKRRCFRRRAALFAYRWHRPDLPSRAACGVAFNGGRKR